MSSKEFKTGIIEPAKLAKEHISNAVNQINSVKSNEEVVEKILSILSKVQGLLSSLSREETTVFQKLDNVTKIMELLSTALDLTQMKMDSFPEMEKPAKILAKTLAILYPFAKLTKRQSMVPLHPAAVVSGPLPYDARRKDQRLAIEADIGFQSETNFYTGFSEDISSGGLFLSTYDIREIGSELTINFSLPDDIFLSIKGIVRWVREYNELSPETAPGMGVQFQELSDESKKKMESFLERREPMFYED